MALIQMVGGCGLYSLEWHKCKQFGKVGFCIHFESQINRIPGWTGW